MAVTAYMTWTPLQFCWTDNDLRARSENAGKLDLDQFSVFGEKGVGVWLWMGAFTFVSLANNEKKWDGSKLKKKNSLKIKRINNAFCMSTQALVCIVAIVMDESWCSLRFGYWFCTWFHLSVSYTSSDLSPLFWFFHELCMDVSGNIALHQFIYCTSCPRKCSFSLSFCLSLFLFNQTKTVLWKN